MSDFPPMLKALAISPKPFALLSILGSGYIFQEVIRSKKKRGETYQRLMAMMSLCDVIGSTGAVLGTWPIPAGTPYVYMASGTTQTCIAAGFFNQLVGPMTPMYNGALGIYYICYIRYSMAPERIKRIEMICHAVIISIGLCTAIAGIPLDLYNNTDNWVCWIAEMPLGCKDSYRYGDEANCERGDNAWIYQWAWFYSLAWASFILMTISLAVVYNGVLEVERTLDSYDMSGARRRDSSNSVFWQGVLYWTSFMITWIFTTISRIIFLASGNIYMWLLFLVAAFWPLQGFWNCLIYLRPRYLKFKRKHPEKSFCDMVSHVLRPKDKNRETDVRSTKYGTSVQKSSFSRKSREPMPSNESFNPALSSDDCVSYVDEVPSGVASKSVDDAGDDDNDNYVYDGIEDTAAVATAASSGDGDEVTSSNSVNNVDGVDVMTVEEASSAAGGNDAGDDAASDNDAGEPSPVPNEVD